MHEPSVHGDAEGSSSEMAGRGVPLHGKSTMQAALITSPGARPRIDSVPMPARAPGQSLLKVVAAALNPIDLAIAEGAVPIARYEQPYIPGMECVGEIQESERFPAGTLVYAEVFASPARPGTFATSVVVADDAVVAISGKPDPRKAVGVGNAGVAAFIPLIDRAGLRENETVLILGATGVVGQIAIQIANPMAPVGWWASVAIKMLWSVPAASGPTRQFSSNRARAPTI
jgi:NADPH2:quinone reductase